jgi:hypothetical protein
MVWKVKERKEAKKQKTVSFADPIATKLKALRIIILDDSILLIKGNFHTDLHDSAVRIDLLRVKPNG